VTSTGQVHPHRAHWDARYRESYVPRSPSAFLVRWLDRLTPGAAIDIASGTGRNALALAARGWRVLGVDVSPVGLRLAQAEARRRALTIDWLCAAVESYPLPAARYDLVCVFRFLDRALCSRFADLVRPGGVLIYETFTIAQRQFDGGPRSEALLLQPGELPTLFADLRPLESIEGVIEEGGRPRALARFVGMKDEG
jgi:tellurite methyltransferase